MKFNENFAAIHAYLSADGYVIKNPATQKHKYYHIGLRNTNETLLKDFQNKFNKQFKIKSHIAKDGRCRIQNKQLYYKLTKDYSFYSKEWQLPESLPKRLLSVWLRAFFDCESWVFVKVHQNRQIGVDSINHKGLKSIQQALGNFGIESILKKVKNGKMSRLYIYKKDSLIKYQKYIGFLHEDKEKRLQNAIDSYVDYNWRLNKSNIKSIILNKTRFKKPYTIRIISKIKNNLLIILNYIKSTHNLEGKITKCNNGQGNIYYELAYYGKQKIKILRENNLLR